MMEGSVLSFFKADWKVSNTGSSHWASSIFKVLKCVKGKSFEDLLDTLLFVIFQKFKVHLHVFCWIEKWWKQIIQVKVALQIGQNLHDWFDILIIIILIQVCTLYTWFNVKWFALTCRLCISETVRV